MSKLNIPEPVVMFLTRLKSKIKKGEYNEYLTIPFASKDMLYSVAEEKVLERVKKGVNPLLNERDMMECVQATISIAVEVAKVYIDSGVLVKTEDGYEVSDKGRLALKLESDNRNRFE